MTDESRRAELLKAFEASGLTQKAFATHAGINYHTFISWLVQQRRNGEPEAQITSPETPDANHPGHLEVRLPGEIVVRGQNPSDIANLVHSLRNNLRT